MTIVVIGGGPTGLELAGAFAELARNVLRKDFRRIDPSKARIILIEAAPWLLPLFPESLSQSARRQVEALGVEVRTDTMVKDIHKGRVALDNETIEAETIIWAAGVQASPLTRAFDCERDRCGRVEVTPDLRVPGHPEVFVIGDSAALMDANGRLMPGVAPAAMQMGKYVARLLERELRNGYPVQQPKPFAYKDRGMMATIGRSAAVVKVGKFKFYGWFAWVVWLFVHLLFLIGFRNKLAVLLQWFYSYIHYKRGARIITGMDKSFSKF